jgi:uncharacterized protein CbrC (UPF0167 family)
MVSISSIQQNGRPLHNLAEKMVNFHWPVIDIVQTGA